MRAIQRQAASSGDCRDMAGYGDDANIIKLHNGTSLSHWAGVVGV